MGTPDSQSSADQADAIYSLLMNLHANKSAEESAMLNTKLVLALASHIGDVKTLARIIAPLMEKES
jgi:hypothetical protein